MLIRTRAENLCRAVFALGLVACYNPKLLSPGYYCHPGDHPACPGDQVCVVDRCVDKGQAPSDGGHPTDGPSPGNDSGAPIDMASSSTDFAGAVDMAQSSSGCGVKVNELQVAGSGGATDEFVELYNSCATSTSLNGYSLVYRSAAGSLDLVFITFGGINIAAGGYVVCGHTNFSGTADVRYSTSSMAGGGGGIAVRDTSNAIVDSVGYGSASNSFVRGSAAPAPPSGKSIERVPDGHDSGNNASDFSVGAAPTPGAANQ